MTKDNQQFSNFWKLTLWEPIQFYKKCFWGESNPFVNYFVKMNPMGIIKLWYPPNTSENHCHFRPLVSLSFPPPIWLKIKIIKKRSHGYYWRVPWLLREGQQLPWLLFSRNLQGQWTWPYQKEYKKSMTIHSFNRSRQNGQFYAAQRTWLAELAGSVPIDGIPQLHPLHSIRMLLYNQTFSWTFTAQSHFAFPELSRLVCILVVAMLLTGSLWFSFFLLSHYIPGSVSSRLHVSSCPSFLSNKSLFRSCNFFCFFSPLRPPADPAFIYAQLQLPQLHPVGLPFSLACVQYSYVPPLPMTSQHSVVLGVI